MNTEEFKYDAFISYRHCELDKFVAVKLHRILETYKIPNSLKKKLGLKRRTFKRVFRDQEELPLTSNLEDPIIDALNNAKYLIVICTPRLKESLWCKKEIETFKKIRGRKNIFCVLAEGEPSDSFPEEVLFDEEEIEENGKKKTKRIMVEPLAADVRGKNKKQVLKKLQEEKLRLIAPMYGLDYDDLKQRHKIWRQKKIINSVLLITLLSVLFAVYSIAMFIKIALQQNVLAKHHALSLVDQAEDYLKDDDRYKAVKLSYQALTDYEDIKMPYTPEAEYSLAESLGIYDVGLSYKEVANLKVKGVATYLKSSQNAQYGALYDGSETLTLFDTKSLSVIRKYSIKTDYQSEDEFTFIGNDYLAYITGDGNIKIVKTKTGKIVKEITSKDDNYQTVKSDKYGKYLIYNSNNNLYIYDLVTKQNIDSIETNERYMKEMYLSEDGNYLFFLTTKKMFEYTSDDYINLYVYDLKNKKVINTIKFDLGYINGIATKDNNAYLLLNDIHDQQFSTIIVSYNFIEGTINWQQEDDEHWGKIIKRTYPDDTNDIVVASHDVINVLNCDDGSLVGSFSTTSEIINLYAYLDQERFLVFTQNGTVNHINMAYKNNLVINGRYDFNVDNYTGVTLAADGFILIPENENRIILYEAKTNNKAKKITIEKEYLKDDSISPTEFDKVAKEYNLNNKSLILKIFYSPKKDIMFVNYKNGDLTIYDTKEKKKLKNLEDVGQINHYFGKDKYGRTYVGDVSDSYILDKDYNKVGHIKGLYKVEKDKVIIGEGDNYYSLKIYTLDDLKSEAKKYLENNKK